MPIKTTVIFLLLIVFSCNTDAQQVITVQQDGITKEVLLLPYYPGNNDTSLKEIKTIRIAASGKKPNDFNSQIKVAASQIAKAGGNVFQITWMQDEKQSGIYKIDGIAYHTNKFEEVKAEAIQHKTKSAVNGKYALISVYRPIYNKGFNDDIALDLTINDTLELHLKGNTKYLVKVNKDSDIKIATADKSIVQHIKTQVGNNYYVRAYTNFPGSGKQVKAGDMMVYLKGYQPYFEIIDEDQGILESSLVNNIVIQKSL